MILSNVLISRSPDQTRIAAADFARTLTAGSVVKLIGDLGSGKTEFVKGMAKGLNCESLVTSPTFTLVHEYHGGRLPLFHMDLYRLDHEAELDNIGFEDYVRAGGVCVVEWADKFADRMPRNSAEIVLTILENNTRRIAW